MRISSFLIILLTSLFVASCSSVYKKHYENGYTFIKHKKKITNQVEVKKPDLQERTLTAISQETKKEKAIEQKKAEDQYQTYHKSLSKIQNNKAGKLLSSINKFTLKKIDALKPDTVYRKEPPKKTELSSSIQDKSQTALIFAIVSLPSFFLVWLLSLIPAIIALMMVQKAKAMAKLTGEPLPSNVNTAKIIAWVTIGLNALSLLLILLYILLIIILLASI
jgi:hypothetical protein